MVGNETFDDLGPGMHVLREAEPLKRAGTMAAQMRAELCATLPQADATLADRSTLPPLDTRTLGTLRVLAQHVARAERMADRTRERAVVEVGHRLSGVGAGLAVHPDTIRDRAAAVEAARAELVAAERAIAEHEAAMAVPEEAEVVSRVATSDDELTLGHQQPHEASLRVRRSRAIGAIVASFGLVLLVVALDLLPLWAALLLPLAASLWAIRYLKPGADDFDAADGREETSSFLADVSAATDELFGARRASQEVAAQAALLDAARGRAEEDVRVAERAWHELAGPDVDVADVQAVVQRFDPQHEDARVLAAETVGVRAAEAVVHQFRQRWVALWREIGLPIPTASDGEQAVTDLAARVGRPIVLVGPATVRGADLARVAPAAPVVVLHGPTEVDPDLS